MNKFVSKAEIMFSELWCCELSVKTLKKQHREQRDFALKSFLSWHLKYVLLTLPGKHPKKTRTCLLAIVLMTQSQNLTSKTRIIKSNLIKITWRHFLSAQIEAYTELLIFIPLGERRTSLWQDYKNCCLQFISNFFISNGACLPLKSLSLDTFQRTWTTNDASTEKTISCRMLWIIEKLCKSQSLILLLPSFPLRCESHNQ